MTPDRDFDPGARDERFDATARALHRDALAQIPAGVRWRLRPAAPARHRIGAPVAGWRIGAALAGTAMAVSALALGVALWKPAGDAAPSAPSVVASDSAMDRQGANALERGALERGALEQGTLEQGTLEQDPDFYAWLASDDAELVAME